MQYLMQLIARTNETQLMILLTLLLMVAGCSTARKPSPMYPTNLEVIVTKDNWVCLSPESAKRLAELKAEMEQY